MFLKIMVWLLLISQISYTVQRLNEVKTGMKLFAAVLVNGLFIYACILIAIKLGI